MRRIAAALLALFAAGAASAQTPAAPSDIYVMRHLNTPEGERDPDLLPEGRRTAETLVAWFGDRPLRAIYVSDYRRTRQTAAPLAARRGLTPVVYDPADTPALVTRVRAEGGPVLIVGHSNTVPDIVAQLGGTRPEPLTHPDFGDVWMVSPGGATERTQLAPHR